MAFTTTPSFQELYNKYYRAQSRTDTTYTSASTNTTVTTSSEFNYVDFIDRATGNITRFINNNTPDYIYLPHTQERISREQINALAELDAKLDGIISDGLASIKPTSVKELNKFARLQHA